MKILLVAATVFEIAPTLAWLESDFQRRTDGVFHRNQIEVFPLVTGVGIAATSYHLGRILAVYSPDLAINAGIAGAFHQYLALGDVVQVRTERFGDLGVEEADGRFSDLFDLGLLINDQPPYINGVLHNPSASQTAFLPSVHGLTVQKVHGHAPSIDSVRQKYPEVQIESMEGAAFFYSCLLSGVLFLEIRSISNYVEPRNRAAWQLPLAIQQLNETLIKMLEVVG